MLDEWIKALKRFALSNSGKKIALMPPQVLRSKRSNQQNKTVMGLWMDIILESLGYEQEDKPYIYGQLKIAIGWFEERVNKKTGLITKVPKPTADLDAPTYSEKIMAPIQRYVAINYEINLPDPEKAMAVI